MKKSVKRTLWMFILILWKLFLYIFDYVENIFSENEYADGEGWSFERTDVTFKKYWYKY